MLQVYTRFKSCGCEGLAEIQIGMSSNSRLSWQGREACLGIRDSLGIGCRVSGRLRPLLLPRHALPLTPFHNLIRRQDAGPRSALNRQRQHVVRVAHRANGAIESCQDLRQCALQQGLRTKSSSACISFSLPGNRHGHRGTCKRRGFTRYLNMYAKASKENVARMQSLARAALQPAVLFLREDTQDNACHSRQAIP